MPPFKPIIDGKKNCTKCSKELPATTDYFYAEKRSPNGLNSHCKECSKSNAKKWTERNPDKFNNIQRRRKLRKYNLTPDEYTVLLGNQNGVCALCLGGCVPRKHFDVDHCHKTGKVRGLLCRRCNQALGMLLDNYQFSGNAVLYLRSDLELRHDAPVLPDEPQKSREVVSQLRYRYGLSWERYLLFWRTQGGACAICYRKPDRLVIDDDHTTGEIRGLLCVTCNLGIGMLRDDIGILARIQNYLRKLEANTVSL